MATRGLDFGTILRTWQTRNGYTDHVAAEKLGTRYDTYKGWKAGRSVGSQNQGRVIERLGVSSYLGATRKYASGANFASANENFETQSEDIFLAYFDGAQEVRETFIMRESYRANKSGYRHTLEKTIYERLSQQTLKIYRVEQFLNFHRLIDVLWNIKRFGQLTYQVRVIKHTDIWFPHVNFTLFDMRAIIAGGFHHGPPQNEPFMDFMGEQYVAFFSRLWRLTWQFSNDFGLLEDEERDHSALNHARKLTGDDKMTIAELSHLVDERGKLAEEFPTRF